MNIFGSNLGKKIKDLRVTRGLKQSELSEGICTQAQISKIERGDIIPLSSTLYLIARRLGVDISYFFGMNGIASNEYVEDVMEQLYAARKALDYDELRRIVATEEKNPQVLENPEYHQVLLWNKGIYTFYLEKDFEKSISILQEAIDLTHKNASIWTESELEIFISMGLLHYDIEKYQQCYDWLEESTLIINDLPQLQNKEIKTKVLYNQARCLWSLQKYNEAIECCHMAIDWCVKENRLRFLAQIYIYLSESYEGLREYSQAIYYFEMSLSNFKAQKDYRYVSYIEGKIEEIKELVKHSQ
ncbi:helix-turn-helix transcriptional regulator [Bacillus infantis]|uniref:helix-turn-helix domain-containing protein n=1 Tax=Bacillus infantis TaxID=324767 RepID=UPI00114026FD|nr:helix-turn-helix domain-containing protein [Bacillus infantis]MCK6207797.1 helix-turn-helix transcriptional regulator [Bacillus infantis]